jgi:hypothetical protein
VSTTPLFSTSCGWLNQAITSKCHILLYSHVKYINLYLFIFLNFSSWVKSNYKRVVDCAAIANSGDKEWNFALERYLSTDLSSEKEMLLYALSCSNSPKALNTYNYSNEVFDIDLF